MPDATVTEKVVASIPSFVIPPDKIITLGGSAPVAKPAAAPPAESPPKEAEPAAEATATPPEVKAIPETDEVTTEKVPESKDDKPSSRSFERKIDRAIRREREALARAETAEREAAELKARLAPPADPAEPKAEQFTDLEEYAKAKAAHAVEKDRKDRESKQKEDAEKSESAQLVKSWEDQVEKALTKYPDFLDVVGELKPTTPWGVAIMEADNGADVAHYLAKHEKEAKAIFALSPRRQFLEIGKLSAKLSATPEAPKRPSKAPAPITPVTGGAEVVDRDYTKPQPFEQYMKSRPKEFSRRHN